MIRVTLKDAYKNTWSVMLPYEINNDFFIYVSLYTKKNSTSFGYLNIWMNDFWADVEFPPEKLDQLYHDFDVLEKNLDEIIKLVPLPEKIGVFDDYYYEWFTHYRPADLNKLKEYLDQYKQWLYPEYKEDKMNTYIDHPDIFTPSDMLLIISLIKKKILEAKEKNETLVFSGD